MKKVILTTIIALVTVVSAFAQSTSNVAVSATVNAALTLTPTNVAFGTIQANAVSYIQANGSDNTAETNLGTTHSAGALQIQGTTGANVTVSWTTGTLTDADGNNPATFTPAVWTTTALTSGDDDIAITGGNITLGVGGSLAAIANPGVYSTANTSGSPVTFTVNYTSI